MFFASRKRLRGVFLKELYRDSLISTVCRPTVFMELVSVMTEPGSKGFHKLLHGCMPIPIHMNDGVVFKRSDRRLNDQLLK
jgi:hypothetical protein